MHRTASKNVRIIDMVHYLETNHDMDHVSYKVRKGVPPCVQVKVKEDDDFKTLMDPLDILGEIEDKDLKRELIREYV